MGSYTLNIRKNGFMYVSFLAFIIRVTYSSPDGIAYVMQYKCPLNLCTLSKCANLEAVESEIELAVVSCTRKVTYYDV